MNAAFLLGRETHKDLADLLESKRRLVLSGAGNETAKALMVSTILSHHPRNAVLVTEDDAGTEALSHWLEFFGVKTVILSPVTLQDGSVDPDAMQALLVCMQQTTGISLCSRTTWDTLLPSFNDLREKSITLKKGKELNFTAFIQDIIGRGYKHGQDLYLQPGEYRRQGDVLDLFPIQSGHPFKITLDLEKIEKIYAVDSADLSRVTDAGNNLTIFPVNCAKQETLSKQLPENSLLIIDDQDDILTPLKNHALRFTPFPEDQEYHQHLRYLSVLKFYTLTDFLNDLRDKIQQRWKLFIVSKRIEELQEIFNEENIPYCTVKNNNMPETNSAITLISAGQDDLLPHSIQNPDLQFALLTDREIFSLKKSQKQRGIQKLALDFITSLMPGDYVVHVDHGIGHFEGMTQKEIDDTVREYLELTYAEGDKLFVPVDQADKLSKHVHEEGNEPVLTRLGTADWQRTMQKARQETEKIAKELLDLYAKRARSKGFAYATDNDPQKEFEKAFPYQETPGQIKAIEDIKRDMEDDHPMDRLICGDVGFGKTEVAMRAAFKAVQSGKQVAFVAPITILADQHYRSLLERMKGFNIRIEMLSRFRTPRQQKEILGNLRKGNVDIVVGTHRLLQSDVEFLNLGLVIIDEEQRFGVKQKEKLKEMRASVDILTLTATPIPRTLNLGLHKLRDITTITTPPPGRLPIITEVRKYSDELVRRAVIHELERDGQTYILHNRVETIDAFADKLRALIPEATFIVAHGQLKPDDLEKRIIDFKAGKYNILVSSTIIENGIDLPRANTLIVNSAENFGLSQLYQLRGRVGRSKIQAFAYFLYHGQKLQEDARKRLRAIVEACELGSGFQVAMRDLEIRGAGEILGSSQSGNMQTVGISHYLRMLKTAVEELKRGGKGGLEEEINVEILLPVTAMIPSFYITDQQEKISMYQKLAGSDNEDILKEFEDDLNEEFGAPPEPVRSLFAVLRLKMACRGSGVFRVKMEEGNQGEEIVLSLTKQVGAENIMQLLQHNHQWRISGSTLRIALSTLQSLSGNDELKWLEELTRQVKHLKKKK